MGGDPAGRRPAAGSGPLTSRIVRVIPDVAAVSRRFDYTVPDRWLGQLRAGWRVRVPLHGRRVGGWVVDADVSEPPPGVELRPLSGVSGIGPPVSVLELAEWAAWRWATPVSTLLRVASPDRNVWSLPSPPAVAGVAAGKPVAAFGREEWSILEAADGRPPAGDRPLWEACRTVVLRMPPATDPLPVVASALALGRPGTVLVLTPEVGWAQRLSARLRRRGVPVAAGWDEAAAGWPVVVGARTAAWAPVPELAAVVVLDAHDEAYGSGWPGYHACDLLAERAAREGAPCLLVSPCPTAVQVSRYPVHATSRDSERGGWPVVSVVDRRADDPRRGLYSEELVRLVRRVLRAGGHDAHDAPVAGAGGDGAGGTSGDHVGGAGAGAGAGAGGASAGGDRPPPVVCVLNRTGRARLLACAACGELARCQRCGRPVEQVGDRLSCRGCGTERPVVCASCGATRFKVLRIGVSRAREELEALLGVPVGEVAGPPASRSESPVPDLPVLVGTEAVLHRVRRASAVAFLDFDQHLLAPRYAAAEQALALLSRAGRMVGGRAGGPAGTPGGPGTGRTRGTVLLQTRLPGHPVIVAAVEGDPARLTGAELALRRELELPPFAALASVSGEGAAGVAGALTGLAGGAPGGARGAGGAGGAGAVEASEMAEGRWLVRAPDHSTLCDALAGVERPPGVRIAVDPLDV